MKKIEPKSEDSMMPSSVGLSKSKKATKIYPRLRLEHQFFPETKDWKVGTEYEICLKVKMTGLSVSKFQNDSEFDITGYEIENESESNDSNEEKE